jgi:hypothetical protein
MTRSSYLVNVTVDGAAGRGTASVPVVAQATARLGMGAGTGWALAALGALLVAGLVTLVVSAVREGVLPAGAAPDPRRRRRARVAGVVAGAVCVLALTGGRRWWTAVDRDYERYMYRPLASTASVRPGAPGAPATLRFTVTDSLFFSKRQTPLMPDHGKLMHLFAVRERAAAGDADAVIAHLHPTRVDSASFDAALPTRPPLPAAATACTPTWCTRAASPARSWPRSTCRPTRRAPRPPPTRSRAAPTTATTRGSPAP